MILRATLYACFTSLRLIQLKIKLKISIECLIFRKIIELDKGIKQAYEVALKIFISRIIIYNPSTHTTLF